MGSQKAYKHLDKEDFDKLSIPLIQTPHPASAWWNRCSKKYANLSGKEALIKALKEYAWEKKYTYCQVEEEESMALWEKY